MRKNKCSFFLSFLVIMIIVISGYFLISFAENGEKILTVYASKEEQEAIMEAIPSALRDYVIQEEITPVYTFSIYNSAKDVGYKVGDKIELKSSVINGEHMYLVTLKEFTYYGEHYKSGLIDIGVKNGLVKEHVLQCHPEVNIGVNYSVMAEDIRIKSGKTELIDPQFVRLVHIPSAGLCFYINDGEDEFFYQFFWDIGETDITNGKRIIRVGEELERAVDTIKEFIEKERLISIRSGVGGTSSGMTETVAAEFHPATGDYSNIELYFGVNIDDFKTHFPDAFVKPVIWPYFLSGGIILFSAAAVVVVLTVIKKKKKENMAPSEIAETREKKV